LEILPETGKQNNWCLFNAVGFEWKTASESGFSAFLSVCQPDFDRFFVKTNSISVQDF